jgi:hypothetical protein
LVGDTAGSEGSGGPEWDTAGVDGEESPHATHRTHASRAAPAPRRHRPRRGGGRWVRVASARTPCHRTATAGPSRTRTGVPARRWSLATGAEPARTPDRGDSARAAPEAPAGIDAGDRTASLAASGGPSPTERPPGRRQAGPPGRTRVPAAAGAVHDPRRPAQRLADHAHGHPAVDDQLNNDGVVAGMRRPRRWHPRAPARRGAGPRGSTCRGAAGTHVGKVNNQVMGVYSAATADLDVVTTGLRDFLWDRARTPGSTCPAPRSPRSPT